MRDYPRLDAVSDVVDKIQNELEEAYDDIEQRREEAEDYSAKLKSDLQLPVEEYFTWIDSADPNDRMYRLTERTLRAAIFRLFSA